MNYDLDRIVNRLGTNSAKYEFGAMINPKADLDTLPLWVADMDFAVARPIQEAMKARINREIYGYSMHLTGEYFRSVGSWMQRRFDWYVNSNDIFIFSGVVPALSCLIKCFSDEGDGVIIQRPVYYPFSSSIEENHRVVVNNALVNNNGYYTMDFDDLEQKAKDPKNKMMILCSPHNPVGRVWKAEELKQVGEICLGNNVILVSDEIHYDIVRKGCSHTILDKLFPHDDRIITCTAPSKSFNLAGLQTSHIVIKNKAYQKRWKEVSGMQMLNPISIWAVQAAYDECEDWMDQVNDYIDDNMNYLKKFLHKNLPETKFIPSEGTYLAWIDFEAYGFNGEELNDLLVKDAKVLLDGGNMFGTEGEVFQRINVACPRSILTECLNRISKTMNKVRIGEKLRNFTYDSPWKQGINFQTKVHKKTYLMFLRYYGCPICQLDMMQIKERYQEFIDKDSQVFVVLQSLPQTLCKQVLEKDIPFEIICDPLQEVYKLYNVNTAYSMAGMFCESVLEKVLKATELGLKHGEYEGNELQFPAVVLFDGNQKVMYIKYGLNPADIPNVDEMLEKLEEGQNEIY
ncbi:PatB family C-S lyase [Alkalibaculum sporogenes]|uniref:PatB family C-S lyase n=1 Tax=Alkalibaculum sporogenes TaxID=2655001 RepID=UPI00187B8C65|nr:PatB family C-S lyase [Alkalibaculum sporogenes]